MDWQTISTVTALGVLLAGGAWAVIKWFHKVDNLCAETAKVTSDCATLAETVKMLGAKVSEMNVSMTTWQLNMNSMLVLLGRRHNTPEFDTLADKFKANTITYEECEKLATLLRNNVAEGRVPVEVCDMESRPCAGVRLGDALLLAQVESKLRQMMTS